MSTSLLIALLLACGEKSSDTASDSNETENSSNIDDSNNTGDTEDTEEVNPTAPVVSNGDAWCFTVGGTTEGEQWAFLFSFSDPQGIETVSRLQMNAITVKSSSGIVSSTQTPACSWDTGLCSIYVFTDQVGESCVAADSVIIEYQIVDEDGNLSNTISLNGRHEETQDAVQ